VVSHTETDHPHIHIVANLVNPDTGKMHDPGLDKTRAQKWALEYELEHGLHCKKRLENAQKRERGEHTKHQDKRQEYARQVTFAYQASDNGKTFQAALKSNDLTLAKGRRGGLVLVDKDGDIQKLARNVDGVKTKEIKAKLSDVDLNTLPDAEKLASELRSFDRDAYEAEQQKKLAQAAEAAAQERAKEQIAQERAEAKKAASDKATQQKQEQYKKDSLAFEQRQKYDNYQKHINKKTTNSKNNWGIEQLEKQQKEAAQHLADNSGFFARIFGRKAQAAADLEAVNKSLEERRGRWESDIIAFNEKRPEWVKKRELEKHGFTYQKPDLEPKLKPAPELRPKAEATPKQEPDKSQSIQKTATPDRVEKPPIEKVQQDIPIKKSRAQEVEKSPVATVPEQDNKLVAKVNINQDFEQKTNIEPVPEKQNRQMETSIDVSGDFNQSSIENDRNEELLEIFAEQQEEIENNVELSEEQREYELSALENQYYSDMGQYQDGVSTEYEQDNGVER